MAFARQTGSVIIFDTAYSGFVGAGGEASGDNYPISIYEVEGGREVALESSSFSKLVGFTGVRLGWTVCPKDVSYADGTPVFDHWKRIMVGTRNSGRDSELCSRKNDSGSSNVILPPSRLFQRAFVR